MNNDFGKFTLGEIRAQDESFIGVRNNIGEYQKTISEAFKEKPDLVIFLGCGTSYFIAASACSYFIEHTTIPAIYLPCFELNLNTEFYIKGQKVLLVPFTRCSHTTEVKVTIEKCRNYKNVKTLAITCDEASKDYNDFYLLSPDASENSIVMTRSYSSMLYLSMIMTNIVAGKSSKLESLKALPERAAAIIVDIDKKVAEIAAKQNNKKLLVCLGQGHYYGVAGENAIKVKEMELMPTEIYYTLEYRHGPISIADENTLFVIYTSKNSAKHDESIITELKGLGSTVISVGESLSETIKGVSDYYFEIGTGSEEFDFLPLTILPGQFLGAHMAISRGLNPDVPRNLSKAVVIK